MIDAVLWIVLSTTVFISMLSAILLNREICGRDHWSCYTPSAVFCVGMVLMMLVAFQLQHTTDTSPCDTIVIDDVEYVQLECEE